MVDRHKVMIHQDYTWFKPRRIGAAGSASVCGTGGREIETHIRHKHPKPFMSGAWTINPLYLRFAGRASAIEGIR